MSKFLRLGVVCLSVLSIGATVDLAFAQRLNFGQQNSNNNRNQDDENRDSDERDEDDEDENNNNNQDSNRSSRSRSTNEQVQQFLQRRQSGQNNQNNQGQSGNQQFRNRQGGQFQDGQFQDGQFQQRGGFQQFQQFRPQDDRQSGLRFGGWQGNQWQGSRDVEKWAHVFRGGQKPFSDEWHKTHPKAWRHEHDHDDFWVAATLPGVYGWLNWGNAPVQPGVRVVTPDYSRYHDFYPLGVFSLMSGPGDMGTRIVQLAIDRHGHIAGNYYDLITDTNSSVAGDVRRDSQRVSWSLNKNKSIRFRASLNRLMQPYGTMVVQMPGGEQDWQFVRLEY
jgi:hypothetical protein